MGKLLYVSSAPSLLQFVVVDLMWVLAVGNSGFYSLHGCGWLYPLLHSLSRYCFVIDMVVEHKMNLNIFWSPWIGFVQVAGQFVKGGEHKLTRVYKRDVVDCNWRVAFHAVGDDSNFSMTWFNSWQYKVRVVSWTQYMVIIQKIPYKNTDTELLQMM